MALLNHLYVVTSLLPAVAGMTIVRYAVRAYQQTSRVAMVHLAVGFTLIVAATGVTTIGILLDPARDPRSLLAVNNLLTTAGFLFLVYSLFVYE